MFGSICYILKDNSGNVGKFDSKAFEAIFLGYSLERTTYRVYVIDHQKVMESMNVTFDDKSYPGTDDNEGKDPLEFEMLMTLKNQKVKKKVKPNEEPTNNEGNSGKKKIIKNKEKSCCLRTHPLIVALTHGEFLKYQHQCQSIS